MRSQRRSSAAVVVVLAAGLLVAPADAVVPSTQASAVTLKAISPTAGPAQGGNQLTISGTGLSGVTAVHFGSAVSKRITHVSAMQLSVRVPKHPAGAVDVRLVSGRAMSARTDRGHYSFTTGAGDLRWGRTRTIDPTRGALTQVSCGTPTFCVAIDSRFPGRNRLVRFGAAGRGVSTVVPARGIDAVACASATYCIAGSAAAATEWNGHAWSAVHRLARWPYTEAMTCAPKSTLCVLVGNKTSLVHHAGGWHRVALPAALGDRIALSCPTQTFCLATDGRKWARFNGTSWGATRGFRDPAPYVPDGLSCASASYCLATADYWSAKWTPSSGWTDLPLIVSEQHLTSPACIAKDDCLVGGEFGPLQRWDGRALRRVPARPAQATETSSSCLPGTGCVFVDDAGHEYRWTTAHKWTRVRNVVPAQGAMSDVSCASSTSCVAVDGDGNELTWNGKGWTRPRRIDRLGQLSAISCASRAFCVAVGSAVVMRINGRWRTPAPDDPRGLADVSCSSARFCVAVDTGGHALRWNGRVWSAPAVAGGGGLLAVSCVSSSSCLAVGKGSARWDGHSWHHVANPPHAWNLTDVDCVSASYCTSGGIGGFYVRNDGLWSHAIKPSIGIDEGWLSCASVRFCIGEADIGEGAAAEDYAFDGASIHQHKRYDIAGTPDCVAHLCATVDYTTATIGHG